MPKNERQRCTNNLVSRSKYDLTQVVENILDGDLDPKLIKARSTPPTTAT